MCVYTRLIQPLFDSGASRLGSPYYEHSFCQTPKTVHPPVQVPIFPSLSPWQPAGERPVASRILGIPPCPLPVHGLGLGLGLPPWHCLSVRSFLLLGIAALVISRALVSLTTRVHSHSSSFFFVEIYLATPLRRAATAPIRRTLF